jgi:hypothetical protein
MKYTQADDTSPARAGYFHAINSVRLVGPVKLWELFLPKEDSVALSQIS